MAKTAGKTYRLKINGLLVSKEISLAINGQSDLLEIASRQREKSFEVTNQELNCSLSFYIDPTDTELAGLTTFLSLWKSGGSATFEVGTFVTGEVKISFSGLIPAFNATATHDNFLSFGWEIKASGEIAIETAGAYQAESTNIDEISVYSANTGAVSYTLRNDTTGTTTSGTLNFAAPAESGGFEDGLYKQTITGLSSGTLYTLTVGFSTSIDVITQFNITTADQELLSIAEADYLTKTGINTYGLPYTVEPITVAGVVNDFSGNANHGSIKNSPSVTLDNKDNQLGIVGTPPIVMNPTTFTLFHRFRLPSANIGQGIGSVTTKSIFYRMYATTTATFAYQVAEADGSPSPGFNPIAGVTTQASMLNRENTLFIVFDRNAGIGGAGLLQFYINNVLDLEVDYTAFNASIDRQTFGSFGLNSPALSQLQTVWDTRFYNVAKTDSEREAIINGTDEIVTSEFLAWYPMTENAGTRFNEVTNGNTSLSLIGTLTNPFAITQQSLHYLQAKGARKYTYPTQSQIDFEIGFGAGITRTNGYTFTFDGSSGTQYIQPDATVSGMQDLIDTLLSGVNYTIEFTITNYASGTLTLDVAGNVANTYTANGVVSITLNASATTGQFRFSSADFNGDLEITSIVCNTIFPADLSNVGFDVLGNALPVGYGRRFLDVGQNIERKATPVDQTFADAPPPIVSDTDYGIEDTTQATDSKWGLTQFVSGAGGTVDAEMDKLLLLANNPAPKIIKRV